MSDQNPDQENVENTADQEVDTAEAATAEQPTDELSLLREQLEAAEASAAMAKDELLRVHLFESSLSP